LFLNPILYTARFVEKQLSFGIDGLEVFEAFDEGIPQKFPQAGLTEPWYSSFSGEQVRFSQGSLCWVLYGPIRMIVVVPSLWPVEQLSDIRVVLPLPPAAARLLF